MTKRSAVRKEIARRLAQPDSEGSFPTLVGDSVFVSRPYPAALRNLPVIFIYSARFERDGQEQPPGSLPKVQAWREVMTLQIEIAGAGDDADDQVDAIEDQIGAIFAADETLGGEVESVEWQDTTTEPFGRGDRQALAAGVTYRVTYWREVSEPEGVLPKTIYLNRCPPFGPEAVEDYEPIHTSTSREGRWHDLGYHRDDLDILGD